MLVTLYYLPPPAATRPARAAVTRETAGDNPYGEDTSVVCTLTRRLGWFHHSVAVYSNSARIKHTDAKAAAAVAMIYWRV